MDVLVAPLHALVAFFHVSLMGALGYSVGVIGFVLIPGAYFVLAKLRAPAWVAAPVAAVVAVYVGGAALALVMGGMSFDDIETHALALARVNGCARATDALGAPIRQTGVTGGTYESRGDAGDSTWELEVEGPRRHASVRYAAEKHGGAWALTALAMTVDDQLVDLGGCRDARVAVRSLPAEPHDVIGLWGEQHGNQLVLTRLAADGRFVAGGFTDAKLGFRVRGTWELTEAGIVWHASKAGSTVPAGYWEQMGEARIAADTNPILELTPSRWVYQEMDGRRTEVVPMDPGRLAPLVAQLDAP